MKKPFQTYKCHVCGKLHDKNKVDNQKLGRCYMMDGTIDGEYVLFCLTKACVGRYKEERKNADKV